MADALARRSSPGGEKSPTGDLTQVDWFGYLEEYAAADAKVKAATTARKELRERIAVKMGDPDLVVAFDRARKDRDVSGEYRAKIDAAYLGIMAWERKAPNFQGGLALPLTQADAARVDYEGMEAGKSKLNRTDNPYLPGQEEYSRWDTAWLRGQAQIGASLTDDKAKKSAALAVVPGGKEDQPRRRGRPPGSKNKSADTQAAGGEQVEPPEGDDAEHRSGEHQNDVEGSDGGELPPEQQSSPSDKYGQEWPPSGGGGNLH